MQKIAHKGSIGMSISESNKICGIKNVYNNEKDGTKLKVERQVWYDMDGNNADYKYLYLINNLLSHLNEDERAVDYRIQIDIK